MIYKILIPRVKKSIIFFTLIFLLISQTNIGVVYAQSVAELEAQKDASIEVLDKTEIVVDKVIEKLDEKINDKREDRLREKEEEIGKYIEQVQEKIEKENSSSDVKKLVKEAKKVVVLKVVSGATEYEDVADAIPSDVANTASEKIEAVETIQESMETKTGDYSILIKTKYTQSQLKTLFDKFDTKIVLDLMYSDSGEDYYEVFIDEDSIFRQEMLEDIESGNLPENFFGVQIIFPEVFSIGSLDGENLTQTWGIEAYKTYQYLDDIDTSIKVGVVDTGIDYNHPDLSSNVSSGYDFVNDDTDAMDDQGHGTHVAGTIAANINGQGIIGVNPEAHLVPLKICNARGFCPSYAVLRALDYAKTERIDILNMSLGGRGTVADHPICAGISAYTDAGGIVVSASGNSNIDTSQFVPGGCSDAITVAAVDSSGNRASFSNYGSKVDVSAPGVSVYSTYPGNQYRSLSGTSMATPHIAGLVSLIQSQDDNITTSEVKALLKKYPSAVSTTGGKTIASAVDIAGVMNRFNEVEVVEVVDVVKEEKEVEVVVEGIQSDDIATIDDTMDFETIPEIKEINLNSEGVEINSTQEQGELISIEEIVEKSQEISLEGFTTPEPGSIEINSDDLPEIEIKEVSLDEFDTTKVKQLYIDSQDGSVVEKTGVEINNTSESQEELIEFDVDLYTGTGFINTDNNSVEINLTGEEGIQINNNEPLESIDEVLDESGIEINSLDETSELIEIEEVIENNTSVELEPIILSEGSGEDEIEINSLGDDEFVEIEEVVVGEIVIEEEEESGIEINNFQEEEFTDFDDGGYEDPLHGLSGISDGFIEDEIEGNNQDNADILPEDLELLRNQEDGIEINSVYPTTDIRPDTIRYVRDWLSGSNKNGGNFWVEIQALERNTLINKAEGIIPVGTRVESETRPYGKITDGSINTYDYAYGGGSLQNVTIDLGSNYDIGMVNVWHYYADKRTFNKTKTEVSEDGETWYVLHDADIDGTYAESGSGRSYGLEEIITTVPSEIRYIRDYINRSNRNGGNHWLEIEAIERGSGANIAEGKSVIGMLPARYETRPFSRITDGSKISSEYAEGMPYRRVGVMVDLEGLFPVDMVKVWHYHYDGGDGRIYNDTKTEVSADGIHWYVLHDSEVDGTYIEPKDASGRTYELRNTITERPSQVRYIRDHLNGSNRNIGSHWIEIQAYDQTGKNVALGKNVTGKYKHTDTTRPESRITDGSLGPRTYSVPRDAWKQVDLGELYDLEMLKVWHYYYDAYTQTKTGRIYNDTKTEISADGVNWYALHDSEVDGTYVEPQDKTGKIYRLTDEPIQKTCITNVGADCHFTFHHASSFDFDIADDSKVSVISSSDSFKLEGITEGKTKVSVSKDGVTYYEVDVEVIPEHTTHNAAIEIGQTQVIQVADADRYDLAVSNGGLITYKSNSREVHVDGMNAGDTKLYLKYKGVLIHTINIHVKTAPQQANTIALSDKIVNEGMFTYFKIGSSASTYRYTVSKSGMISTHVNYDKVYIKGLQPGNVILYVHDDSRGIIFSSQITINKSLNNSISTVCYIRKGGNCDIRIPNADTYDYTISAPGYISYARNSNLVRITGENGTIGTSVLLYLKRQDGTTAYDIRVFVRSNIITYDIDLFEGQEMQMNLRSAYNHDYSITKKGIIGLYTTPTYVGGDYMYIKGYQAGNTVMYIQRGTWMIALNINVTEKPKEYECTIEVGMRCYLNLYRDHNLHERVKFEVANREIIQQTWWNTDVGDQATIIGMSEGIGYFSVQGIDVGKTHNLKVNVVPVNTINVDGECELDIGENCRVRLRGTGDYELTVSSPGIITASRTNDEYLIYGLSEGSTNVYIKKDGIVVHTIYIEVSDIKNLSLGTYRMDIETREEDYFIITTGNGDYRIYKDNDNVSIYATSDEERYRVYANKPGITRVMVYDKENRFSSFTVYVEGDDNGEVYEDDAELILNTDNLDNFLDDFLSSISGTSVQSNITINNQPELSYESKGKLNKAVGNLAWNKLPILKNNIENFDIDNYSHKQLYSDNETALIRLIVEFIYDNTNQRINGTRLHIQEYECTPNVEDGYIGGCYFKVNNPDLVKEAGFEYYDSSVSNGEEPWKGQQLQNEGDGEFATFVLSKTSYQRVRGYVTNNYGGRSYTSINGETLESDIPYYLFYEDLESQSSSNNGVEVASAGAFVAGGLLVTGLGWTLYTCIDSGLLSKACAIDATLTFVPLGRVGSFIGKVLPKKYVLKFWSPSALAIVSDVTGNAVESFAKLGLKAKLINELSKTSVNFSADLITHIRKSRGGQIFWLEKGNSSKSYDHIFSLKRSGNLTRYEEMVNGGTIQTKGELIDLMYDIINTGSKKVTKDPITGFDKWFFTKTVNGRVVGVATGSNGYIVTVTYN